MLHFNSIIYIKLIIIIVHHFVILVRLKYPWQVELKNINPMKNFLLTKIVLESNHTFKFDNIAILYEEVNFKKRDFTSNIKTRQFILKLYLFWYFENRLC